ncbi:MAG: hypothetical protein ACHQJ6_08535 [Candidatus Berkiellales bacterium]
MAKKPIKGSIKKAVHSKLAQKSHDDLPKPGPLEIKLHIFKISDFASIPELKKALSEQVERKTDLTLTHGEIHNELLGFLKKHIQMESDLAYLADSFGILHFIDLIEQAHGRTYKSYDHDCVEILSFYKDKITGLINQESTPALIQLESFFDEYHNIEKIKLAREKATSPLNPFSDENKLKEIIAFMDQKYKVFCRKFELVERQKSQATYWELLQDVLSDKVTSAMLQLSKQVTEKKQVTSSLLPESEFDIPSAEPEHPDRVGINETMSFNPPEETPSVSDAFSTKELEEEFLGAFPWATDLKHIHQVNDKPVSPETNLLGTPTMLSPELQLAAIQYALLTLDALGKVAGIEGDLTIQNFAKVKEFAGNLQLVSDAINQPVMTHPEDLKPLLEKMTSDLASENQLLYILENQENSPLQVQNNHQMNGFCHVNEHLAHHLSGIPYSQSILMPNTPTPHYQAKIDEIFMHHPPPHKHLKSSKIKRMKKKSSQQSASDNP